MRRRAPLWVGLALVIVGLILLAVWGGLKVYHVRTCADSTLARLRVLQDLGEGISEPAGADLKEAGATTRRVGVELHGLQQDLACLRTEVKDLLPLAPLLGWVPKVGPDLASAPVLMDMAQALVDGGVLVYDSLSPLVEQMEPLGADAGGASTSGTEGQSLDLPQAVATMDAARPSLAAAEAQLQRAANLRTELGAEALSPRLGRLLGLVDRYLPLLQTGVRAAQAAPGLLGVEGARTYLVLAQNDDERRPTGGWISAMGLVTVEDGQIIDISFRDSWAVDNLQVPHDVPPEDMFRVLWAGIWLFRDANWSPDFPTSARMAERILERDQGIAVDGVIAVDQQALQLLVAALEPLTVGSNEEPITGANVLTFIRDSWTEPQQGLTLTESRQEWTAHRKDFMAELVAAMLNRVQAPSQSTDCGGVACPALDPTGLATAIWRGVQERHILVYLHDATAAELLASLRWDGALRETSGDYLQIVDANVGFNKVDPSIQRTITYQVDLTDPDRAQAEAVVRYENQSQRAVETCLQQIEWLPAYEQRMHGCYWDYVRFYVPEGARLLPSAHEPLPAGSLLNRHRFAPLGDAGPDTGPVEKAKTAFGLFFVLPPSESREVRLSWSLPAGTVKQESGGAGDLSGSLRRYQLLVQKQSGTPAIPLQVTLTLPPGSRLITAQPEPFAVQTDAGGGDDGRVPLQVDGVTFALSLDVDQWIEVVFQEPSATPEARSMPEPYLGTPEPVPAGEESPGLSSPRQRFGFVVPMSDLERYDVAQLGAGWYLACPQGQSSGQIQPQDPSGAALGPTAGMECAQLVGVSGSTYWPEAATLQEMARRDPGQLWIVGNEPDVVWQANATPQEYAKVYREVYQVLKGADPTCQVAIAGISQVTPLRLGYLEEVLAAYEALSADNEADGQPTEPMPVDVWTIHLAILREERGSWGVDIPPGLSDDAGILYGIEDNADVEILKEQVVTFRRWMAERGLRDKPLLVTEFSILMPPDYGFPFERVRDFMLAAFDFFMAAADDSLGYPADGYRLVQRWAWYSVADQAYSTGNLFDPETGQITPLGRTYAQYVAGW